MKENFWKAAGYLCNRGKLDLFQHLVKHCAMYVANLVSVST